MKHLNRPSLALALALLTAGTRGLVFAQSISEETAVIRLRKEMSKASLLLRAGKKADALAAVKALFPTGPTDEKLALEYYRIVGADPGSWNDVKAGLERLVQKSPDNVQFREALKSHLSKREVIRPAPPTREKAIVSRPRQPDVQPDPMQALRQQAGKLMDEGQPDEAGSLFEQILAKLPNDAQIVGNLGLVRMRQGRHGEATVLFQRALNLDPQNASKWTSLERVSNYWHLIQESSAAQKIKDYERALVKVQAAMAIDADNAEGIALGGSIWLDIGNTMEAEKHFQTALKNQSDNGSAIRGYVRLLSQKKRFAEALQLLNSQGKAATSPDGEYTYLRVGILRDEADILLQNGQAGQAVEKLNQALALDPINPWVRYDLATFHLVNDSAHSRTFMDEGLRLSPGDPQMQYASALYFAKVNEPHEALRLLSVIPSADMSASMQRLQRRMGIQEAVDRANARDQLGDKQGAADTLDKATSIAGEDPDALYGLANAWLDRGSPERGLTLMRSALSNQVQPAPALQLRFAALLNRIEQDAELTDQLIQLSSNPNLTAQERSDLSGLTVQAKIRAAYKHLAKDNSATAQRIADELSASAPDNYGLLILQGNIARQEHRFEESMAYFRRAKAAEGDEFSLRVQPSQADEEIMSLERRRQGSFLVGYDAHNKPGTPGISDMAATEVPMELRLPIGYIGHARIRVNTIDMRAGTADMQDTYNLLRYGKVKALQADGPFTSSEQLARGTGWEIAYETDSWQLDLGTTPVGFLVQNVVGGLKWSGGTAAFSYAVDVSRRPITSNLLSYAGAADPITGEVWGGVRSDGVDISLHYDKSPVDTSLNLGYHVLGGKNVLSNTFMEFRPEISWTLLQGSGMRISTGLSYTYWKYDEDLSYYTFGHGGYYSPQSYQSISVPLRLSGRIGKLEYVVRSVISASWSYSKDMPYYPTDSLLQTQAGNPTHSGGDSSGTGYSLATSLEYEIAPKLYLATRMEIGRAAYYAPNTAIVSLRYQW